MLSKKAYTKGCTLYDAISMKFCVRHNESTDFPHTYSSLLQMTTILPLPFQFFHTLFIFHVRKQ